MSDFVAIGYSAGQLSSGTNSVSIGPYAREWKPSRSPLISLAADVTHVEGALVVGENKINVMELFASYQAQIKELQDRLERVELAPFSLPYYTAKAHFEKAAVSVPDKVGSLEDDI